jgi:hypothetical protein
MQQNILYVFILNLLVTTTLFVLFVRPLAVSRIIKALLYLGFIVSPVFMGIKGQESLVYIQDIIGPFLFIAAFNKRKAPTSKIANLRLFLFLFLLAWPIFTTGLVFAIGNDDGFQFDSRGMFGLGIWLYRNLILFSIFILASSAQIDMRQLKEIFGAFLVLSLGLLFLAIINYTNIYNLAVYEQVLASLNWDDPFNYTNRSTLGWGFLGMFRGSMGQWYANSALLALGAFVGLTGFKRVLAAIIAAGSAVLVFCSYSRAGMVALALSLLIYTALLGMRGWRLLLIGAVCAIALVPLMKVDTLQERVESISTYSNAKEKNRIDGWRLSLDHFQENPVDFVIGVGATNRQKVANAIGAFGAHNEYIDSIFRAGIFCTILLLVIIAKFTFYTFKMYRRASRPFDKATLAIAPSLFISNAAIGFTQDHLFRSFSSYVTGPMLYFLYGILIVVIVPQKLSRPHPKPQLQPLNFKNMEPRKVTTI